MSQFTAVLEATRLSKAKRAKPKKIKVSVGSAALKRAQKAMDEAKKRSAAVDAGRQTLKQLMASPKGKG